MDDPDAKKVDDPALSVDDEPKVDDDLEPTPTGDDDEPKGDDAEYYASDEEFLKGYHEKGLPDTITSVEDAMDFALKASEQAKTGTDDSAKIDRLNQFLAQKGIVGGIDAMLAGGTLPSHETTTVDDKKEIIPSSPAMDFVEEGIRTNRIKQDDAGFFRHQAEMTDAALKAVLQPVKQALGLYARQLRLHQSTIGEMEWQTMPRRYKESVKRHELDALINANRADSYIEAFKMLAFSNRPDLLRLMADDGKTKPRTGALKKHSRRQIRKPRDWSKYTKEDGTLNQAELAKLSSDDRLKVLKEMEKELKKE